MQASFFSVLGIFFCFTPTNLLHSFIHSQLCNWNTHSLISNPEFKLRILEICKSKIFVHKMLHGIKVQHKTRLNLLLILTGDSSQWEITKGQNWKVKKSSPTSSRTDEVKQESRWMREREKSKQCNGAALVVYHKANTNYNYYTTGSRAAIEFGPINETRQQLFNNSLPDIYQICWLFRTYFYNKVGKISLKKVTFKLLSIGST